MTERVAPNVTVISAAVGSVKRQPGTRGAQTPAIGTFEKANELFLGEEAKLLPRKITKDSTARERQRERERYKVFQVYFRFVTDDGSAFFSSMITGAAPAAATFFAATSSGVGASVFFDDCRVS